MMQIIGPINTRPFGGVDRCTIMRPINAVFASLLSRCPLTCRRVGQKKNVYTRPASPPQHSSITYRLSGRVGHYNVARTNWPLVAIVDIVGCIVVSRHRSHLRVESATGLGKMENIVPRHHSSTVTNWWEYLSLYVNGPSKNLPRNTTIR